MGRGFIEAINLTTSSVNEFLIKVVRTAFINLNQPHTGIVLRPMSAVGWTNLMISIKLVSGGP